MSFCTLCIFIGRFIRIMVSIFSGLISIFRSETKKSSNFLLGTLNEYLAGLSLISYLRRLANVSVKSVSRSEFLRDLITILFIYVFTFRPIWSRRYFWIMRIKVVSVFFKLNGIVM